MSGVRNLDRRWLCVTACARVCVVEWVNCGSPDPVQGVFVGVQHSAALSSRMMRYILGGAVVGGWQRGSRSKFQCHPSGAGAVLHYFVCACMCQPACASYCALTADA